MNIPVATWLPLPKEFETMSRVRAVRKFRSLDHKLANGERVRPTLRTALNIVDMIQKHGMRMPVAISEGSYHTLADIEAERKLQKLKEERFAHFCKMDGHDGTKEERSYCDGCKESNVLGTMIYRPDSHAHPVPVMFYCYGCSPKK